MGYLKQAACWGTSSRQLVGVPQGGTLFWQNAGAVQQSVMEIILSKHSHSQSKHQNPTPKTKNNNVNMICADRQRKGYP